MKCGADQVVKKQDFTELKAEEFDSWIKKHDKEHNSGQT